jgi:hypothetical protein
LGIVWCQIEELTKSKEENYIIEGRLSEKDREIAGLKEKYDKDIAFLKDEMRLIRELLNSTISR